MIIALSGKKQHGKNTVANIIQYLIFDAQANAKYKDRTAISFSEFMELDKDMRERLSGWQQKSWADKLKQIVCILIGCTMEQLEDNTFKETPLGREWWVIKMPNGQIKPYLGDHPGFYVEYPIITLTPRLLLQLAGTDCGRNIIHPNIWVNALMADYKWIPNPNGILRNMLPPNWIITDTRFSNEVKAVESKNGITIRVKRPSIVSTDTHESETALDGYFFDDLIINDKDIDNLIFAVQFSLINLKII